MTEPTNVTVCHIPLGHGRFVVIDQADYEVVSNFQWHATNHRNTRYAAAAMAGKYVYLHRFLMKPPAGTVVDHLDGNGLNCRRNNLRVTNRSSNGHNCRFHLNNTSGYRGVYRCKFTGRWRAEIRVGGKAVKLGRFDTKEEGARYAAAAKYHGEHARVNFPQVTGSSHCG